MKNFEPSYETVGDVPWIDNYVETNRDITARQKERSRRRRQRKARNNFLRPIKKVALFMSVVALSAVLIFNAHSVSAEDALAKQLPKPANENPETDNEVKPVSINMGEKVAKVTIENEAEPDEIEVAEEAQTENPFGYSPEVWQGVVKAAKAHDIPLNFATALIQQESHGDPMARSKDGFASFGLSQPSMVYHFSAFAPALEKAGLLSEISNKPAVEIVDDDNAAMLKRFENLHTDWKSYQDIVAVLCDIDTNLDVGFGYLKKQLDRVKQKYPDCTPQEQLSLAAMAYNGGPNAPDDYMAGKQTPASKNYQQYEQFVMGYYDDILAQNEQKT